MASGAVLLVRTRSYPTAPAALQILAAWQYVVVRDVARRIVQPDVPLGVPTSDEVGVADYVDAYLVDMRPALRRDFLRLLMVVEHLAPALAGHASRFTSLSPAEQDDVLARLEASSVDQLRAGFQALKSVVMLGYYRDPRTFAVLGYRGPLVDAPSRQFDVLEKPR